MDLVELFGFLLVNGRSASDPLGDYTFMRGEAQSTIDLCMARGTWIETIKDFQVSSQIFSDHLRWKLQSSSPQHRTQAQRRSDFYQA